MPKLIQTTQPTNNKHPSKCLKFNLSPNIKKNEIAVSKIDSEKIELIIPVLEFAMVAA